MKVVTSCVFAALAVVYSAPTAHEADILKIQQDFLRDKRSQYGVQYVSPCAASAPIPAFAPYHYNVAPHGGYIVPHYAHAPHYRSMDPLESDQELLEFSDMNHIVEDHMPSARYGYAPAHVAAPMLQPIAAPTTYGVFPNANSGGCNVPLLFSCSPSIVQGRMVNPQPHGFAMPVNSYRDVVDHHLENHEENDAMTHDHHAHEPSHISLNKS